MQLSKYEQQELHKIQEWKAPSNTWLGKVSQVISSPFEKAGNYITDIKAVEWVIEKAIGGTISTLNDFSQWTVRPDAVYKEYQKNSWQSAQEQTARNIAQIKSFFTKVKTNVTQN